MRKVERNAVTEDHSAKRKRTQAAMEHISRQIKKEEPKAKEEPETLEQMFGDEVADVMRREAAMRALRDPKDS